MGQAMDWDAGRRLWELMGEESPPGDATPWEALSAETRAYYGRVAAAFLAEYQALVVRNDAGLPDQAPRGDDAWGRE